MEQGLVYVVGQVADRGFSELDRTRFDGFHLDGHSNIAAALRLSRPRGVRDSRRVIQAPC
ncbi:hypothetical protein C5E02_02895 [Rathayibacter rathayi]|nr:hypothetical protein C1O28_03095 [Rathayibacter rathayi]PPF24051.1 hypothetical protein C5C34_06765 [Rathayibacter rathayi]PPG68547.1 hypothetical protein C5C16_07665 [Rathayibacter rathayi]PPG95075.1 hypothetical protein C5C22_07130 [Rathayibacter rathayi]PPH34789.1 hypothetical protein C5C28_08805 [Rathayibacter rathayi]